MNPRTPTITTLVPTIENCDPIVVHRRATPHAYSLSERPVLYGGGRKWSLRCSDPSSLQFFPLNHADVIEVDLFVLNSALVIWFVSCNKGVEVPYSALGAHAVRNVEGKSMLYLQVNACGALESDCYSHESGLEAMVEFEITPMFAENERYYYDTIERLFTYEYFGINKGDKMVMTTFHAISQCSAMYLSEEEEEEEEDDDDDGRGMIADMYYEGGYDNTGDADDMDMNTSFEDGALSGVDVVFYDEYGRRRTREEMDHSPRDVKRVRC